MWKFSSTDQNEIARNSVLQSGWEMNFKKHFLGDNLQDITMTNVPLIRLRYRQETLQGAIDDLVSNASANKKKGSGAAAASPGGIVSAGAGNKPGAGEAAK